MIPFADLITQHARLKPELDAAVGGVLARGDFVLGAEVQQLEQEFSRYCGAAHGIGVSSGTSALHLALLAAGLGPGDEVITTAFSFVATVAAIGYTGARPVLVDLAPEGFTLDPERIEAAITPRTRAIVPVHLYGHPADLDPILELARRRGLVVIEDAAQAHGAQYKGRRVGALGDAGCFSFYPAKNLGACGEAGMVVTDNPEWDAAIRALRHQGQTAPYRHERKGYNYRMDGLQGAILRVKLRHLDDWNEIRRANAACYDEAIAGPVLTAPSTASWARHVYHIYAVRTRQRALAQAEFLRRGIETRIHYPDPLHLIPAWADLGYRPGDFPRAERAAAEVLSIPVHPELSPGDREAVADAIRTISLGAPAEPPHRRPGPPRRRAAT